MAKSSDVLGNAAVGHASRVTASMGMSAEPQQQSSTELCRRALRALHETGLEILVEK